MERFEIDKPETSENDEEISSSSSKASPKLIESKKYEIKYAENPYFLLIEIYSLFSPHLSFS